MSLSRKVASMLEWFIPADLKNDPDTYRRAQMFVGALVIGTPLAYLDALYLYIVDPAPGAHFWLLVIVLAVYYVIPFLLRWTGRFVLLSLLSIQLLCVIILFASFHYGGASSPFLIWMPVVPLLAFFYLGARPRMRVVVLSVIGANLAVFYLVHLAGYPFPEHVPLSKLSGTGVFSVCVAVAYVAIMSIYYERIAILASEIKAAHIRADHERQQAEMANRAKSEFLARISHELRTPLNAVLGYAQLLEISPKEPLTTRQGRQVGQIRKSGQHLLALIDEVLDLSRIEAGTIRVSIETVDLDPIVEQVRATLQPLADNAQIRLAFDLPANLPAVRADRMRLVQILMNLGTNAIKYNRRDGVVTLRVTREGPESVRVSVIDTGIGIALDRHVEVFQPFNRLGAEHGPIEGSGIGLALSYRLALLMNGRLSFRSESDKGSAFSLDLPIASPEARPSLDLAGALTGEANDHPFTHQQTHCTLLYVEDNPSNIMLMQDLVDSVPNLRLLTAAEATTGLALAHAHRPDVIVLDINLPGMNGFEILRRLKHAQRTADIPVMALTAAAQPKDVERGRASGFTHYLTKPINVQEFLSAIDLVLDRPNAES